MIKLLPDTQDEGALKFLPESSEEELKLFLQTPLWRDIKTWLEYEFGEAVASLVAEDDPLKSAYLKGEARAFGSLLTGPEGTWEAGLVQYLINLRTNQTHFEEDQNG